MPKKRICTGSGFHFAVSLASLFAIAAQAGAQSAAALASVNQRYNVPADPDIRINEDGVWRFKFRPAGVPQSSGYDDGDWAAVDLPHTWNAVDGASTNYAQGAGWYRKVIGVPSELAGKKLYLHFEGSSVETSVYVDGVQIHLNPATPGIDSHRGAFQAFDFDVSNALNAPVPAGQSGHLVAVSVNNSGNPDVPPCGWGDYSKEGGLYRSVSLIAVDPAHAALFRLVHHTGQTGADAPSQISSPAVQFTHSPVVIGSASTEIKVQTTLDNSGAAVSVGLNTYLVDASGIIRATSYSQASLPASQTGALVSQDTVLKNPHLWDGRIDPYLYTLYVEIRDTRINRLLDLQKLRVGIRSFQTNPNTNPAATDPALRSAFTLNGHPYRLVGADMHQDSGAMDANGSPVGWARSEKQIRSDIDMLIEMGGTAIRTSHYQDNQAFYQYCDEVGVLVYTESPINGKASVGDAFLCNAEDQYNELIHQTMNDPSVFAWGFGNETSNSPQLVTVFKQFNEMAHALDATRKTGFATYGGSISSAANADGVSDIKGTHLYDYWYGAVSHPDNTRSAYPGQPLGVTEYGGGASAYQYVDSFKLPVSSEPGGVKTHFHPANQQTRLEELQYTDLSSLTYLWGQFTWQMFDNASSGKNEGDQGGVNDKGLVTRDRVRKDSYYFYKANLNDPDRRWGNERILYISDRYWTTRSSSDATVTVFSNVGAPSLSLNGISLGQMAPLTAVSGTASAAPGTNHTVPATYIMNVKLAAGVNSLQAVGTDKRGGKLSDSVSWSYFNQLTGTPITMVEFHPAGQPPREGFLLDSGQPFAAHDGQHYGWRISTTSPAPTFESQAGASSAGALTLNYDPVFKTSSTWEYQLPHGVYDVEIGAGRGDRGKTVNNFAIDGKTVAVDSDPIEPQTSFHCRINVTGDHLSLSAAPGAFNPRMSSIQINRVSD